MVHKSTVCLVVISLLLAVAYPAYPATTEQLVQKGQTYLKFHRYKEAVKTFSQAIQRDRNYVSAYLSRAIAWYNLKEYDLSISDYSRAITARPDLFEAYIGRAAARFAQGKYQQAIDDYKHILAKEPYHPDANNQLAWLLAVCPESKYRNGKKAVKLAERAVESETSAHYLDTLAAAYAEAGRFRDAERTQKSVIFLLMKQDQTGGLDQYVRRLTFYQKKRPWRVQHLARKSPTMEKLQGTRESAEKVAVKKSGQPEKAAALPASEKSPAAQPTPEATKKAITPKAPPALTAKTVAMPAAKKHTQSTAASTPAAESRPADGTPDGKEEAPIQKQSSPATATVEKEDGYYPYTIQVSSYRDARKSKRITLALRKKGDAAFTSPVFLKSGVWHRIFLGFYPSLSEARKAAALLKKRRFRQHDIFNKPWTLQVGIFKTREGARAMERIMYKLSLVPYRIKDMYTTSDLRLLFGAFETRQEAARVAGVLKKQDIDSRIVLR